MNQIYIVVGLFFSVYMVFTWVSTSMTGYQGSTLWFLRALMALVGIIAMVAYIWYQLKVLIPRREKKEAAERGGAEQGSGADDVDILIRDAESRLATSELGKKAKLANVPVLLIVGRDGSAKTSTTVNSGLSPDLLAGHVYRENTVIPTAAANVWYAQRSGFVEAGGKLLARADSWGRLLKKLRPGGLSSVFGAKQDAPRAALVCISCEEFLKPGAGESLAVLARE
jgi:type VI secretion system protein ImpL